ncbi:hypothetical protein K2173_023698 [Erythroxylum novogranatense]|uniref:Retrovirus-related Pol polyprotein from transposon TNT 1-94 n=1 Tax=Erythroxylum novogranatense TaxID=1862640 RepID=A0AAV8TSB6_9ROSI|nr:hypothetical protein K2173_023698 [Erythroxylum novogranatense]
MSNNLSLKNIMDANKLLGPNFVDWFCNLRIILKQEKKLYVLDNTIPQKPDVNANDEVCERYQCHINDVEQVTYVMLASMSPEFQKQYENMNAPTIILHLKELFGQLGFVMDHEFNVDLILQSLTPNFSQFVMNYNMNQRDVTLLEVLNTLKTAEECLKKEANSIIIANSSKSKKKCYKKNKKQKTFVTKVKSTGSVKK